jgi:hypothetical protein
VDTSVFRPTFRLEDVNPERARASDKSKYFDTSGKEQERNMSSMLAHNAEHISVKGGL